MVCRGGRAALQDKKSVVAAWLQANGDDRFSAPSTSQYLLERVAGTPEQSPSRTREPSLECSRAHSTVKAKSIFRAKYIDHGQLQQSS